MGQQIHRPTDPEKKEKEKEKKKKKRGGVNVLWASLAQFCGECGGDPHPGKGKRGKGREMRDKSKNRTVATI